jgi:hypothetical protein
MCQGKGTQEHVSFSDHSKKIERPCSSCHGKKTQRYMVDVYDVVEHLRALPVDKWTPQQVADLIEAKWGSPAPGPDNKEK